MSRTYAIADLHGRADLLQAALEAIAAHAEGEPGTVVTIGDYVDRGPESAQIIRRLREGLSDGWKLVCLQGNHEAMMLETLLLPLHPDWWIGNGGGATLVSYGHPARGAYDPTVVPQEDIDWLKALPLIYVDEHRVFVHAGVDPTIPLEEQTAKTMQWMLYPDGFAGGHGQRHVVHGHHQFAEGPMLYAGRSDFDTFAWATGQLAVGVFDDDKPGGPVDIIEVILARDPRYLEEFA